MQRTLIWLAVFALPACSQTDRAPSETATPAPTAAQTVPAPTPAPVPAPAEPAQIVQVPAKFHGIWDYVKGTCNPASDMRTEIAERGITFYESHGAVTALMVETPDAIVVDLAMAGEGEKWTMRRRFTLSSAGQTLTSSGVDQDLGQPMPLTRCA